MPQMLYLATLAAAATATATAAPSNSSQVQELVGTGKDTSDGTMFEVNVFYDSGKTPDCKDKSVASVKDDPDDCVCLYTLIACVASVKLDTSKASDDDETTIDASVYLGSDCTGQPIIGGDTDIPCDTCSGASLAPLGVTTQAICPCL